MGAALYMALSRTLIRTYAADYPWRPDLVLQTANDRILSETGADLFVTVFLGMLDPNQGTLTYCNAGHHPPYWLRPRASLAASGEEPIRALPGRGIALGVVEEPHWGHSTIHLDPGASLLLYTDGVVDAHNADLTRFGSEGIIEAAKPNVEQPAWKLREGLLTSLYAFTGEEAQFDDITLLVVRRES
jgi:sigma-B regulation protein RsbU (phosphoserine phosphatase)